MITANIFVLLLSSTLPTLIISIGHIVNEHRYLLDGARCKRNDQCKSNDCRGSKCGGRDNDSWCIDDDWCKSNICSEHKCVNQASLKLLRTSKDVKTFVFRPQSSGIGSTFIHMLAYKSHFEGIGYKFSVYDVDFPYKYEDSGVLSAFFDKRNLTILNENDHGLLNNAYEPDFGRERAEVRRNHSTKGLPFYEWLSKETCKSLQFSKIGMERINDFIGKKFAPNFFDNSVSIGFHVRRGDKLDGESPLYEGNKYVEKALSVTNGSTIDTCFVATDDFEAVDELKRALLEKGVGCEVYTLDDLNMHGNVEGITNEIETLRFISELSILSRVTYFVGSFNSNASVLVSLLRSCHTKDDYHFYQSFGVGNGNEQAPYWR